MDAIRTLSLIVRKAQKLFCHCRPTVLTPARMMGVVVYYTVTTSLGKADLVPEPVKA